MRRLALVLSAVCATAVAALPAAALAQATPTHDTFRAPFEFTDGNPCTGESITFSGQMSGETTTVVNASGGSTVILHQVLTAQGLGSLGNRYTLADSFNTSVHFDSDSAPSILTQIIVDRVITQGQRPKSNYFITVNHHVTMNANGEVTAQFFDKQSYCR